MAKYDCLSEYLNNCEKFCVKLSFEEIDEIVKRANKGDGLPASASRHRRWWKNDSNRHIQAKSWMNAGWKVSDISLGNYVEFEKDYHYK